MLFITFSAIFHLMQSNNILWNEATENYWTTIYIKMYHWNGFICKDNQRLTIESHAKCTFCNTHHCLNGHFTTLHIALWPLSVYNFAQCFMALKIRRGHSSIIWLHGTYTLHNKWKSAIDCGNKWKSVLHYFVRYYFLFAKSYKHVRLT